MARATQSLILDLGRELNIDEIAALFRTSKALTENEHAAWEILFKSHQIPISRKDLLSEIGELLAAKHSDSSKKVAVSWIPNVFLKNLISLDLVKTEGSYVFITGDVTKVLLSKLKLHEKKQSKHILKSRVSDTESLLPEAPGYAYIDGIFHQIIPNAIRSSTFDKRKTISVNISYPVKNSQQQITHEFLRIVSSCRSTDKSSLATLDDIPYTIMLDSMFVAHVKEKAEHLINSGASLETIENFVGNRFYFDIYDLCSAMDITNRNASSVYERLLRLADSEFEIDYTDAPHFLDRVNLEKWDLERYRYFTEIKIRTDIEQNEIVETLVDRKPRFIEVVFHSSKFKMLIETGARYRRFAIPIELARERDGLILKLVIFLRQNVGTTKHARSHFKRNKWLLHELAQKFAPNYEDIRNFERDFYKLVEKNLINGGELDLSGVNVAEVHGYRIELNFTEKVVREFTDWFVKAQKERRPRRLYPLVSVVLAETAEGPSPETILRAFDPSNFSQDELNTSIHGLPTQIRTALLTIQVPDETIKYFDEIYFKDSERDLKLVYLEDLIKALTSDREVAKLAVEFCLKASGLSATTADIGAYCLAARSGRQMLSAKSIISYFTPKKPV